MNKKIIIAVLVVLVISQLDISAQCAMCKSAAESTLKSDPKSMARSLNSGILYLMAVPYVLIAFIFRKQIKQLFQKWFKKPSTS